MAKLELSTGMETRADCADRACPFHGHLKVHGRVFRGTVTSAKAHKTVTVNWERRHHLPKYERYEKRYTKIYAHNPPCISAGEGDIVRVGETRPLSKTKTFVVLEVLGKAHIVRGEDVTAAQPKKGQGEEQGKQRQAGKARMTKAETKAKGDAQ